MSTELKNSKQVNFGEPAQQKPLRLLPGVVIVILQWLLRFGLPQVAPGIARFSVLAGPLGGLAVFVWWGFFSRAPRIERWGAVVLMIVALVVLSFLSHDSIRTGLGGIMFFVYAFPVLSLAFVVWAAVSRGLSGRFRFVILVMAVLLTCGIWTLVRSDNISSRAMAHFAWRWSKSPEEKLLDQLENEPLAPGLASVEAGRTAEWPGFRGPGRNSIISGVRIKTDWFACTPKGTVAQAYRTRLLFFFRQR